MSDDWSNPEGWAVGDRIRIKSLAEANHGYAFESVVVASSGGSLVVFDPDEMSTATMTFVGWFLNARDWEVTHMEKVSSDYPTGYYLDKDGDLWYHTPEDDWVSAPTEQHDVGETWEFASKYQPFKRLYTEEER